MACNCQNFYDEVFASSSNPSDGTILNAERNHCCCGGKASFKDELLLLGFAIVLTLGISFIIFCFYHFLKLLKTLLFFS